MVYNYWKPISIGIFFAVIISVDGRPAEKRTHNVEPQGPDALQILELNPSHDGTNSETESRNPPLHKVVTNRSLPSANLNIPVHVIYDSADKSESGEPATAHAAPPHPHRDSRRGNRNMTDSLQLLQNNNPEDPTVYYLDGDGEEEEDLLANDPVPVGNLKTINRNKNPFAALILTGPEFLAAGNSTTSKKVPVLYHLFSSTSKNKYNDTVIERIDHKYLIPILEKLKQIAHRKHHVPVPVLPPQAQPPAPQHASLHPHHPHKKVSAAYPTPQPPYTAYPADPVYMPAPYPYQAYPPMPQYYPYDLYRQWNSPFNGYYPPGSPTSGAYPVDYINDLEYGDPCQHHNMHGVSQFRMGRQSSENGERREEEKGEPSQEAASETGGKRRYDEDPHIEYVDHLRSKRSVDKHDKNGAYTYTTSEMRRRHPSTTDGKKEMDGHGGADRKAPDVGPQISKLIVRRGGVAIAGPGGIATAGSGGTAIVGPGGTAFTTPASSGGVAMVGPGGKVVKIPEITNVLYGRTASVAATGAGHTTYTNKNGEVFTTGDDTGGVALVNPDGDIIGMSDGDIRDGTETPASHQRQTKELHVPIGARLLTTGPIIYYNPVYPPASNQLR